VRLWPWDEGAREGQAQRDLHVWMHRIQKEVSMSDQQKQSRAARKAIVQKITQVMDVSLVRDAAEANASSSTTFHRSSRTISSGSW
jgi:hypothetical protein